MGELSPQFSFYERPRVEPAQVERVVAPEFEDGTDIAPNLSDLPPREVGLEKAHKTISQGDQERQRRREQQTRYTLVGKAAMGVIYYRQAELAEANGVNLELTRPRSDDNPNNYELIA